MAKKEIGKISKDSTNPFFKSKYFDINQLLEHVEPILDKKGLILMQPIFENKVITEIFDIESGESVKSEMQLSDIADPQKRGSEITYFRRYTLQSLLALQAEDDDANTATKAVKTNPEPENWLNTYKGKGSDVFTDEFTKAHNAIHNKGYSVADIRTKWKVSKTTQKDLENKDLIEHINI